MHEGTMGEYEYIYHMSICTYIQMYEYIYAIKFGGWKKTGNRNTCIFLFHFNICIIFIYVHAYVHVSAVNIYIDIHTYVPMHSK